MPTPLWTDVEDSERGGPPGGNCGRARVPLDENQGPELLGVANPRGPCQSNSPRLRCWGHAAELMTDRGKSSRKTNSDIIVHPTASGIRERAAMEF